MQNFKVCILTAGKGTRMAEYGTSINKALLPINKKAVISLIIDKFPKDTEFVIALGHKGTQVKTFLEMAHPESNFNFVSVDNFDGVGSGPGYSLLCCETALQCPFYFVSCDTLWRDTLDFDHSSNWVGVSTVAKELSQRFCNFEISNNNVTGIYDKKIPDTNSFESFVGLAFLKDYKLFWDGLKTHTIISGEHQISNGLLNLITADLKPNKIDWVDIGTIENYKRALSEHESYDFSKSEEFIYQTNNRVIKFFSDSKITEKRGNKTTLNPRVFPKIVSRKGNFLCYEFVEGKTLYDSDLLKLFPSLLIWLKDFLWKKVNVESETLRKACRDFYLDKSIARINKFYAKFDFTDKPTTVNGIAIPNTSSLLSNTPWEKLLNGVPTFIHGDLQFDNILYLGNENQFVLLDWRQDFGGHVEFGDLYYDLAKLYGGIILNYDLIKQNKFSYQENNNEINFSYQSREINPTLIEQFVSYLTDNNLDFHKVKLITSLIYLNMSPLHKYPFDKLLFSLGRLLLFKELNSNDRQSNKDIYISI